MTKLPEVIDLSLRQAQALLAGADFKVKEVVYQPSDYRDLVLEVLYDDKIVNAGEEIPTYSELILHVGDGGIKIETDTIAADTTAVIEEELPSEDELLGDDLLEDEILF